MTKTNIITHVALYLSAKILVSSSRELPSLGQNQVKFSAVR